MWHRTSRNWMGTKEQHNGKTLKNYQVTHAHIFFFLVIFGINCYFEHIVRSSQIRLSEWSLTELVLHKIYVCQIHFILWCSLFFKCTTTGQVFETQFDFLEKGLHFLQFLQRSPIYKWLRHTIQYNVTFAKRCISEDEGPGPGQIDAQISSDITV